MSYLYSPYNLKGLELKNRIVMSPMATYSAENDGRANDWHLVHYTTRAVGGVGLIIQEATAVETRGRMTDKDLGLWEDGQVDPLRNIVGHVHSFGAKIGIQLAHAGRKGGLASEGIVAPSALKWSDSYPVPAELTPAEIGNIVQAFGMAAQRAAGAGYDLLEVHAAHGYLIHEFLSPLSNIRQDSYGVTRENRVKFLREVLGEIHNNIPPAVPVLIRVSANDYVTGGIDVEEMVEIINLVKDRIDAVDVSSGGLLSPRIDLYPGYQVTLAATIREKCGVPTIAVGLITQPEQGEQILGNNQADLVALGRELLRNPYWPLLSAKKLGEDLNWPFQYARARI